MTPSCKSAVSKFYAFHDTRMVVDEGFHVGQELWLTIFLAKQFLH